MNPLPNVKPMLAHTYFDASGNPDKNKEKHIKLPFFMQPKIDGVRMIVGKHIDGTTVVMSRTGKPVYNMHHITDEIIPQLSPGEFVDGENFTFDMTFEEITGICRTSKEKHAKNKMCSSIKFYVYDYFNLKEMDMPFSTRSGVLKKLTKSAKNTCFVPTITIDDRGNIRSALDKYIQEGYEGGMIRNTASVYKLDARSNDLLKVKYFVTDEYKIVGFLQATGRDEGTVIWKCESENGVFKVRPRGTIGSRREYFENGNDYLGKMLTVQYQNLTDNGIPRFPVGLAIRDYE
jgi:ATP-dependent DNA ligase